MYPRNQVVPKSTLVRLWPFTVLLLYGLLMISFSLSWSTSPPIGKVQAGIRDVGPQQQPMVFNKEPAISIVKSPFGAPCADGPQEQPYNLSAFPSSSRAFLRAIDTMQSEFFQIWQGTWPTAIDWTAAVLGTHVSASLRTMAISRDLQHYPPWSKDSAVKENLINHYTQHITSFCFGQNAIDLRRQAYDDMLWVVLGWLETIKFIDIFCDLHPFAKAQYNTTSIWYAQQFVPAFAHRVRIFYNLASRGWDTTLCGGGMIWSPFLAPYKNAITNQLYIAASVSMYLYFPGDTNSSPFRADGATEHYDQSKGGGMHDIIYLEAAVEGYRWLVSSNMTNNKGLYVDGFHIKGWRGGSDRSNGSGQCDLRDEQIYSYNQGVLLTALRGLWEATGKPDYLEDGHTLVSRVIDATGWNEEDLARHHQWAGIGRHGVLEDACDSCGGCGQDPQAFKGIFFLHLTTFCAPLPVGERNGIRFKAKPKIARLHEKSCEIYGPWIRHNAKAALGTRDDRGRFGMWWTAGLWSKEDKPSDINYDVPKEGTDYRNNGVPNDNIWQLTTSCDFAQDLDPVRHGTINTSDSTNLPTDPNSRGRGRTVEPQSGGVAVLRALYNLVDMDRSCE